MTTAELYAWRWGARAAGSGIDYARLAASSDQGAPCPLDADDRYALVRLGPEQFLHWALKGHVDHNATGG